MKKVFELGDKVKVKKNTYIIFGPYFGEGVLLPSFKLQSNPKEYLAIAYVVIANTNYTFISENKLDIIKAKDIKLLGK